MLKENMISGLDKADVDGKKNETGQTDVLKVLSYIISEDKKDIYTVRLDNGEILDVTAEEFFENSLYDTDLPLSIAFDDLVFKIYSKRAFYEGVRFVLFSKKTVFQVVDHLRGLGFDEECIDFSVKSLSEEGYLDDFAYAKKFIKKTSDSRIVSTMMIVCELKQKGISEDMTRQCLGEMDIDDYILARKAVDKKKSLGVTDMIKIRRFLAGKGFSSDSIRRTLDTDDFE